MRKKLTFESLELRRCLAASVTSFGDLNLGTASFAGTSAVELNGQRYMFGNTGAVGRELYRLNNDDSLTLIKDVTAGAGSTDVVGGAVIDDLYYFVARTSSVRVTLHRTDGTSAGTFPIGSFRQIDAIVLAGSQTFLAADNGSQFGMELWKTDGTVSGTALVKDIELGYDDRGYPFTSSPRDLTEFNGKLYFTAETSGARRFGRAMAQRPVQS